MFQLQIHREDGSGSGFGSWKTVPAVPVPRSVPAKTVPTVPVSGSWATLRDLSCVALVAATAPKTPENQNTARAGFWTLQESRGSSRGQGRKVGVKVAVKVQNSLV